MLKNVKRGADPEFFLVNAEGKSISSIGLIGGSKANPRDLGDGYAVQEDNVAVEFNIPPADSKDQFVHSIHHALSLIKKELATTDLDFDISATAYFDHDQLRSKAARIMGCEPDYNAWTMDVNPRPVAPKSLRSAGGHLHISWDNPDVQTAARVIKVHDLFCGVPSLIFDNNKERREIYGKAGACRFKDYGVEYRTLSNFWIKDTNLTRWLYEQSEKAIDFLNGGNRIEEEDIPKVINCINNSDYLLMEELTAKYNVI